MALFGAPAHFYQATCPRPIAPHSTVPLANYSPLHNSRLPPLAALFSHIRPLPYSHQSHSSISYDVTAPTPRTRQSLHPSVSIKMAACTQVNAAHCYQHCATLYTKRHDGTNISYPFFQKSDFQKKNFGALSRGPGGFCPSFSNSPTPPQYPLIFSQLSTSIHTSIFTVLPNGLTARSYVLLALHQGVPNLWARAIHGPHSPLVAVEPNLHRHPYAPTLLL